MLLVPVVGALLSQHAASDGLAVGNSATVGNIGCAAPTNSAIVPATRTAPVSCQSTADTQVTGGGNFSADQGDQANELASNPPACMTQKPRRGLTSPR